MEEEKEIIIKEDYDGKSTEEEIKETKEELEEKIDEVKNEEVKTEPLPITNANNDQTAIILNAIEGMRNSQAIIDSVNSHTSSEIKRIKDMIESKEEIEEIKETEIVDEIKEQNEKIEDKDDYIEHEIPKNNMIMFIVIGLICLIGFLVYGFYGMKKTKIENENSNNGMFWGVV